MRLFCDEQWSCFVLKKDVFIVVKSISIWYLRGQWVLFILMRWQLNGMKGQENVFEVFSNVSSHG